MNLHSHLFKCVIAPFFLWSFLISMACSEDAAKGYPFVISVPITGGGFQGINNNYKADFRFHGECVYMITGANSRFRFSCRDFSLQKEGGTFSVLLNYSVFVVDDINAVSYRDKNKIRIVFDENGFVQKISTTAEGVVESIAIGK